MINAGIGIIGRWKVHACFTNIATRNKEKEIYKEADFVLMVITVSSHTIVINHSFFIKFNIVNLRVNQLAKEFGLV